MSEGGGQVVGADGVEYDEVPITHGAVRNSCALALIHNRANPSSATRASRAARSCALLPPVGERVTFKRAVFQAHAAPVRAADDVK